MCQQVALGISDGSIVMYDIAATAVRKLSGTGYSDVQSMSWAAFPVPADGSSNPEADEGDSTHPGVETCGSIRPGAEVALLAAGARDGAIRVWEIG